ncbi:MAG TPA: hypothetical protein V6D15_22220 [Oculatellaceae cyanobacterium]|jgi:hypothetical protein
MDNSELQINTHCYVENKDWKRVWRDDYAQYAQKSNEWQTKSTFLLGNVVVALNDFANCVRKNINPEYMILQGRFIIYDSLGILNEGIPAIHKPDKYIEVS